MKRVTIILLFVFAISCKTSQKVSEPKPLYETLTVQEDGGATIRFFEILSEEREIKMLKNDEKLKNKIGINATKTSNFVILNMGEKPTIGYTISILKVEETPTKILIYTQDNEPQTKQVEEDDIFYYPYTIIKINSKKEIEIQ